MPSFVWRFLKRNQPSAYLTASSIRGNVCRRGSPVNKSIAIKSARVWRNYFRFFSFDRFFSRDNVWQNFLGSRARRILVLPRDFVIALMYLLAVSVQCFIKDRGLPTNTKLMPIPIHSNYAEHRTA